MALRSTGGSAKVLGVTVTRDLPCNWKTVRYRVHSSQGLQAPSFFMLKPYLKHADATDADTGSFVHFYWAV